MIHIDVPYSEMASRVLCVMYGVGVGGLVSVCSGDVGGSGDGVLEMNLTLPLW